MMDRKISTLSSDDDHSEGDFGFEIKQMSADADAILESIRSEATKPAPSSRKKSKSPSKKLAKISSPRVSLSEHFAAERSKSLNKFSTAAAAVDTKRDEKKAEDLPDDNDDDSYKAAADVSDNHSLTTDNDGSSVMNDSLVTDDDMTDDGEGSMTSYALKRQMAAELMAAELKTAEAEFHQASTDAQAEEEEKAATAVQQGVLSIPVVLVWAVLLFLLSNMLGSQNRILDDEGHMTFPTLQAFWLQYVATK